MGFVGCLKREVDGEGLKTDSTVAKGGRWKSPMRVLGWFERKGFEGWNRRPGEGCGVFAGGVGYRIWVESRWWLCTFAFDLLF